ncbi:ATP-binding protein [Candidatus Moduliflexota bacterium]
MFPRWILLLVTGGYLSLLFLLAYYAERRERSGRSIVANPYVYSISLAVYCTSWTFYGSVGKAAVSGLSFLAIYLGPTLAAALWCVVLRRIITIAREHRITTIADFIGFRYGNSLFLAAMVTVMAAIGITPYLGLQIKAIITTYTILAGGSTGSFAAGWLITLILALFAVVFGVRRHDISEKHGGLVFAIAFESIVKLAAFLTVGVYVTYIVFDGFSDIFRKIGASEFSHLLTLGEGSSVSPTEWGSLIFLSMMAIMFLPRQFHIAVVENHDVRHVTRAVWLFPLYLLLINIFVLPVAWGGLLLGESPAMADTFVLHIPLDQGKNFLALFVFLGGISAASGMIIVESLAISNMVMNNLVAPAIFRFNRMRGFSLILSNIKRLVIMAAVFLGYLFAVTVGEYFSLVDMGLLSFVAVSIFAPSMLIGLYWKGGNRNGAIAGVMAGFAIWCYTLLLPALIRAGIIPMKGAANYLMESKLFNPHSLMGIKGLDEWSHALFWGLLTNVGLYVALSLLTRRSEEEERTALLFVESYESKIMPAAGSVEEVEAILTQFIGAGESREVINRHLSRQGVERGEAGRQEIIVLQDEARRILSGMLGSSIARLVFEDRLTYTDHERVELLSTIQEMNKTLRLSRQELAGANRQLALLKEFSENIIESLPLGVATLDIDMRIRSWNRGMEAITGYGKEEAHGAGADRVLSFLSGVLKPAVMEGDLESSAGNLRLKGYISRLTGAFRGYVVVLEDVTEKKGIEEELFRATKHASVGRLAAGVAHEIGNPLASISSLVQELVTEEQSSFGRQSLETINHHVDRIARIVRNLGDFARISPRRKELASLRRTLDSTLDLIRYDKSFRDVSIHTDFRPVPLARIDADQVQQVFFNLILNARDAMDGRGDLHITLGLENNEIHVVFTDSGGGIDAAIRDKIFDPFFTTKGPTRGTGLGLGISYGIIKDHGGEIEVTSGNSGGARFTIRLPLGGGPVGDGEGDGRAKD